MPDDMFSVAFLEDEVGDFQVLEAVVGGLENEVDDGCVVDQRIAIELVEDFRQTLFGDIGFPGAFDDVFVKLFVAGDGGVGKQNIL